MIKKNGKQFYLAINGKKIIEIRLNGKLYYSKNSVSNNA